jgi:hypothetical protein
VLLIALQLSLLSCAFASDQIRTLLIGQVVPETCPLQLWFDSEPLVDYTMVPTKVFFSMSYDDAKRFVKIYFPRNRAQIEDYGFFMFVNPYFEPFTPSQVENMRSAIVEGGSGALQTLGGITINWADLNTPWLQSTLAPIFPNDPDAALVWEQNKQGNLPYKVILEEDESLAPLLKAFKPLGIEETPGYWTIVLMLPQEGATVWARAVGAYPGVLDGYPPWLLSWRYGEGMTWSVADDLDCPWWWGIFQPSEQRYGLDILMNIILHSLDMPLPEDVVLVNAVRQSFMSYIDAASRLTSVLDFVEKFGANTNRLMDDREKIDLTLQAAKESYMDGFYEEALVGSRDAIDSLLGLEEDAIDLKRQALAWVYVIEWTSVTGTGMLVGVAVYLLMVRRRLYRQVGVTRLA